MREPAEIVKEIERAAELPPGGGERFSGYGVMGLPFRSGHVLGLRRFPASSIGPGYRAVWHRDPDGLWTFYQDRPAELACTRYFGSEVDHVREGPIAIDWTGPRSLRVRTEGLEWAIEVASTAVTRAMNAIGSLLTAPAWRSGPVLDGMSRVAGTTLRAGRIRLTGLTPNGQRFFAHPVLMWVATESAAIIDGADLGAMGPAPAQASLRDFSLPHRGMFVVGSTSFRGT